MRPIRSALPGRSSSSMMRIVAFAAAQDTGLPPKVEIVSALSDAAISGVAMQAPSGSPFAMPLAIVIRSGSTP